LNTIERNIDINKKDEYLALIVEFKKKYKDKKSEFAWADDEWEESAIKDEMDKFSDKILLLNKKIETIVAIEGGLK